MEELSAMQIMKTKEKSVNGHYKPDIILTRRSIQEFNEMKSVSFNVFSDISILIKKRKKRPHIQEKVGKILTWILKSFKSITFIIHGIKEGKGHSVLLPVQTQTLSKIFTFLFLYSFKHFRQ